MINSWWRKSQLRHVLYLNQSLVFLQIGQDLKLQHPIFLLGFNICEVEETDMIVIIIRYKIFLPVKFAEARKDSQMHHFRTDVKDWFHGIVGVWMKIY